ncbi:MAG: tRNA (adenosine(37)-N6)-threonylcarbamoyltransferase complex dimerization subunit type 1 TsaB [Nitrospirota bacterium]
MKILGIETATGFCGVALVDETRLIAEFRVSLELKQTEGLLPLIDGLLKASQTTLSDLDAIAVSIGPGSFTGLRAGVATAKGLAIGRDLPLIAISTLEAMAFPFCNTQATIIPIIPSRKGEVYWASFSTLGSSSDEAPNRLTADACDPLETLLDKIGHERSALFTGDGARIYRDQIIKDFKGEAHFPTMGLQSPLASCVAEMGRLQWISGKGLQSAEEIVPVYLHTIQIKNDWTR